MTQLQKLDRFGKRLRELRLASGLTQRAAAKAADIHPVYWNQIEHGHYEPGREIVRRLARVLDVSAMELEKLL